MSETPEHRGWEISSDYHEHWMDDPDYDLSSEKSGSGFLWAIVLLALALVGGYFFSKYMEAPPVTFKITPPMLQYVVVPAQTSDPLHACGKLPACPTGRTCQIDPQCHIAVR